MMKKSSRRVAQSQFYNCIGKKIVSCFATKIRGNKAIHTCEGTKK